jgi:hypothetical protein
MCIGGFAHDGVHVVAHPWISTEHCSDRRYLVFGELWQFADGDDLMFDLSDPSTPVVLYLHEHGPSFERYAPSLSLALWRMVSELEVVEREAGA